MSHAETWIVTADGARARIFEEKRRLGELHELPDRAMQVRDDDRPSGRRHLATVHDRQGVGRHGAGELDLDGQTARRFLRRVALELERAAARGEFGSLVLMAPPRARGRLRSELSERLRAQLAGSDHHDAIRETPEQVRERLRDVRARSWGA